MGGVAGVAGSAAWRTREQESKKLRIIRRIDGDTETPPQVILNEKQQG
jgi:hypothetical protein